MKSTRALQSLHICRAMVLVTEYAYLKSKGQITQNVKILQAVTHGWAGKAAPTSSSFAKFDKKPGSEFTNILQSILCLILKLRVTQALTGEAK